MRRIFFFVLVNVGVVATVSLITWIFGIGQYLTPYGLNVGSLLAFCLVWGMVGSVVSLLISRWMVIHTLGVVVIEHATTQEEKKLVQRCEKLSRAAGLPMPMVGIYESDEVNACATGPSKRRALVAVSSGLLTQMDDHALDAILGHEITHIANGDMVTLTLLQGVVNAFTMFLARVVAYVITTAMQGDREDGAGSMVGGFAYMVLVFVLDMAFSMLGSLVVLAFSRWREYGADAGGAHLAGKAHMIHALECLHKQHELATVGVEAAQEAAGQKSLRAFMIDGRPSGIAELFSSHPPLEKRIAALRGEM